MGLSSQTSRAATVLFDSHHPKHYLTVRKLAQRCRDHGIDVVWTARDKDVVLDLMRADGVEPHVLTRARKGLISLLGELIQYDWRLYGLVRKYRPVALVGKNISVSHVGWVTRRPSLVINDDDAKANPQYPKLAYPFATRIITPDFLGEDYGRKHVTFTGLCELAYLHPDTFRVDPGIRRELGVSPDTTIYLIRLVALQASHDIGASGLSTSKVREIINRLSSKGRVFISSEGPLRDEFSEYRLPTPPARIHHVVAESDLLICDSQTMAAEAAVLGTPSLRMNSFVGRITYLELLEKRFGLTFGFTPDRYADFSAKLDEILSEDDVAAIWRVKRDRMLEQWSDPTDVFWRELAPYVGISG